MKRVYFSDVHMNVHRKNSGKYKYVWLSDSQIESFAAFLRYLNSREDISEIVMVGDILDTWICPIDAVPPSYQEILEAKGNESIVKALQAIDGNSKKGLIYLPGNHDMTVDKATIKKFFPNTVFGGNHLAGAQYVVDSCVAEHGTSSAMYNGPDPESDPVTRLPLGYFITRVGVTAVARNQNDIHIVNRILQAFAKFVLEDGTLGDRIFDAVVSYAGLDNHEKILMPDGSAISFDEVRSRYADIYKRWENGTHLLTARNALLPDAKGIAIMVKPLQESTNAKIVILGHTHEEVNTPVPTPEDEPLQLQEEVDGIYENCGCWCNDKGRSNFVETEVAEGKHHVRMMYWEDNQAKWDGNAYFVRL
jgi:UDP-2,3-diacylglucosamine pyrophosphatase LpxH